MTRSSPTSIAACPLHDIGKVGIPDEVLQKPGKLTPEEFDVMKEHTTIGANILEQAVVQMNGRGFLVMAMDIARSHHERWDGRGYPRGLAGIEIPLAARIVAVADVYDALTSERCYKEAWTPARASKPSKRELGRNSIRWWSTLSGAALPTFSRLRAST